MTQRLLPSEDQVVWVLEPALFERMFTEIHKLREIAEFVAVGQDAVTGAICVIFSLSEADREDFVGIEDDDEIEITFESEVLN